MPVCVMAEYDKKQKESKLQNKLQKYVLKSIKHIAQSATNYENENSLERTFEGYLDINNICVNVSPRKLNVLMYTSPLTRELFIEPKLILEAENDAQVSSVLAHELAHITMNHADELPKEILNDFNLDKAEVIRLEKSCKKDIFFAYKV